MMNMFKFSFGSVFEPNKNNGKRLPNSVDHYSRFNFQYMPDKNDTLYQLYTKGARVWIPDPEKVWRAAELLEDYKGQQEVKIQYEEGEESVLKVKDKASLPHLRNPDILIGENDLTSLSYLNEPEVLYNLMVRFEERNIIYTYCGIVLVAINPYEQLPIYGNDTIQAYSGQDMGALDPHIYAVAEEAFKRMSRFDQNQSIIVSGESGAGKTVSAKYAMRYFAAVGGSQLETQVERKVLASNPIMEAIGNAKTTRNDNSSRFGKYIEIGFSKSHEIIGAHMRTYLLEKSRVVFQAADERNYHIFYQLCASSELPEFQEFLLLHQDDFYYTSQGGSPDIDGVEDAEDLLATREALTLLGVSKDHQIMMFRILSAILHFGNVKIKEKDSEHSEIGAKDMSLDIVCTLLGIDASQMRMWLCNKKIQTVNETLVKPLNAKQASFSQDALAKHIYSQLFKWVVHHVNSALKSTSKQHKFIGVLDIYGFETFEVNSFEQFCINYANEKLQQIFNMHVFKLEQEEYIKEKIEWSFIDFYDNQPCIDLIENKLGILDLLDEECKMPKGSDANWCQKLYDKHIQKSQHFEKPRTSRTAFIIHHFADLVTYETDGFLEKNRDTVLEEQIKLLKASEHAFIAELFEEASDKTDARGRSRTGSGSVQPLRPQPKTASKQHKQTVGSQFRDSLRDLMKTLNATTPHYIRCIKPNDEKAGFMFNPKRAVEQLRACGVLETIRISAAGYPSRWTYNEFFHRYRVLAKIKDINKRDTKKTCENILNRLIQDEDKYRFGKTKIFFRAGQVAYMEKLRSDKLRYCGIMIQKHVRGWLQKRRYQKIRKTVLLVQTFGRGLLARRYALFLRRTHCATTIQKTWRGYKERKAYKRIRNAVITIQCFARGTSARKLYHQELLEAKATRIQKMIRSFIARKRYKKVVRGIILIQSHYRRRKARTLLKILKVEARSVEHFKNVNKGLENKIIELQQKFDQKNKEVEKYHGREDEIIQLKSKVEKFKGTEDVAKTATSKVEELQKLIAALRKELEEEKEEKKDIIQEKHLIEKELKEKTENFIEERKKMKEELDKANRKIQDEEKRTTDILKEKLDAEKLMSSQEFDTERQHHQKLVKEYGRLQQRFENLQSQVEVLTSPTESGHKRNLSDISAISLDSIPSSVDTEKRDEGDEKEDQGYGSVSGKRPPTLTIDRVVNDVTQQADENVDVGLVLKLQNKISELEREKKHLQSKLERLEDDSPRSTPTQSVTESAFDHLKKELASPEDKDLVEKLQNRMKELNILPFTQMHKSTSTEEIDIQTRFKAYDNLQMQELENENDKLKREVSKLMKSIADNTNFESNNEMTPAAKEFMDQFEAMTDELERRREECLQLRALLAESSISTHTVAKESYGGNDEIVNEDNELVMAYKTQRELNRLLESQLQKTEKENKKKESEFKHEITALRKDNERQQKLIGQNLTLTPEAKIEATMQHEITRLTSENLDLRETIDKQTDQIRKLKKMLKIYAKRLKEGEGHQLQRSFTLLSSSSLSPTSAAEIAAELEKEVSVEGNADMMATVKHRERAYLGMFEYKKEDENALIKNLIMDLKPKVASGLLPGCPAYILFMCVRHTDYTNDDEKVRALLTNSINGIKKVVKKYHEDLERVTLWLANTCRLLHTLKQYSGEKQFQTENTSTQNEQALRNFDLSEYRQVFSDLAVWIYQGLIKLMEEIVQPMIVPAVLEHEAIAGLTGSKPTGLRGRSSSTTKDLDDSKDYSLDSLMKTMNMFMRTLKQFAVDPELVKQIFRQVYYFVCASALNNLLLRKDMCNWSKGMQIRYNLSHLEQWMRDNKLQESGVQLALDPIIQASQLLQARKTVQDVDSICEMCSKLTVSQIVKILNLYTPVDEFEERVPISFIRKIQEKLKIRQDTHNTLLMDTKYSFSVTFPFNPSSIALETVQNPEQLHLGFLKKV